VPLRAVLAGVTSLKVEGPHRLDNPNKDSKNNSEKNLQWPIVKSFKA
jgi:hypothetical protein